jgi:hypothetical protein
VPFYNKHIDINTLSQPPVNLLHDFFQSRGCRAFELTKGDFESGAIATGGLRLSVGGCFQLITNYSFLP